MLRELRDGLGLSRDRLAALAGVSSRTIFAIEQEGVRPQPATARVVSIALTEATALAELEASAGAPA